MCLVPRCLRMTFVLLFCTGSLFGQEEAIIGQVIQIAGETVYVNAGRKHGRVDGDVLRIVREGTEVAKVRVVRLSDSFSACEVIFAAGIIRAKDEVVGSMPIEIEGEEKEEVEGGRTNHEVEKTGQQAVDKIYESDRHTLQLRGKVALRYSRIDDRSASNRDVHRPSAVMSLELGQTDGLRFQTRFRARKQDRRTLSPLRLYDLALNYAPEGGRFAFGVGRLNPTQVAGVGDFDGALMSVGIGGDMHAGVFGGFQPNLQSSGFSSDVYKMGAFIHLDRTALQKVRQNMTVAFVGQYQQGQIDREYVYFQNFLWFGRKVSLYQHVELDLDRTARTEQMKSVQLTNLYSMLRISPKRYFSASVGYDARNLEPRIQAGTVVDSLLDSAFRQGFQGDISLRPFRNLFLYARGNVRLRSGEEKSQAISVGGTVTNLLRTGTMVRGRYTHVDNVNNQTRDINVGLGRDLGRLLHFDAEWGEYRSLLAISAVWDKQHRGTGRLQVYLPKRTFFSFAHTIYYGAFKRTFTFAELSLRF